MEISTIIVPKAGPLQQNFVVWNSLMKTTLSRCGMLGVLQTKALCNSLSGWGIDEYYCYFCFGARRDQISNFCYTFDMGIQQNFCCGLKLWNMGFCA